MIKEVTKQNTITNIEPTISEGKGIYLITKNKLHICEDGADFMDMMQQLPEYEPMVLIKGELETLHAEMGRHDLINAIRALEPQEVYDNLIHTLKDIDLTKVVEMQDNTAFGDNIACGGPNGCEI